MSAVDQAYRYAINLPCDWIIVTSIRHTRLYHKGSTQQSFELFDTVALAEDQRQLEKFVFLLAAERVAPLEGRCHLYDLLTASEKVGQQLTKEFYVTYADRRQDAFEQLCHENPDVSRHDLLQRTQKILDRVLFCSFCKDRGLLPGDIIERAYQHRDPFNPRPIWDNFRGLFRAVDKSDKNLGIEGYNGGLFAQDALLDRLNVPDEVCGYFRDLAAFDYRPAHEVAADAKAEGTNMVDVEILGHIFEQSITDLEKIRNELDGLTEPVGAEKHKTRRKKEGAFYTPNFVTRYIIEQALGPVLKERFERVRQEHAARKRGANKTVLDDPNVFEVQELTDGQRETLIDFWKAWETELATIRLLDPACGSGAFLIEAFTHFRTTYQTAHDALTDLRGHMELYDLDRQILEKNLYGVDLNEEAIEICRLSLWIRTAERGKTLTNLDPTIRVGNSVIADKNVHPSAFDWRAEFPEVFAADGFDVVVGNPPYVRQEWISQYKPHFQKHYRVYDGAADLYVYFYELGINVLKPGGRLSMIVTNKWMKAGYGEPLRRFFGESAWVESLVNFGHAKQIFVDADVFPSILVARKPTDGLAPANARICDIARDTLRVDDLSRQIEAEGFEVPRDRLGGDTWMLDPPGVVALMNRIQQAGVPLRDFLGTAPLYGIKTGLNDAFFIDDPTRRALIEEHPSSDALIRTLLRGQDLARWRPEWSGLWIIFSRRGHDIDKFPAIKRHLETFRNRLEPKPRDWQGEKWEGRKAGSYSWFETQDPVDYWEKFTEPKIVYQVIQFHPAYAYDDSGMLGNDKTFILPTGDLYLLGVLNSPLIWWRNWRTLTHLKDEALSPMGFMMENLPVAQPTPEIRDAAECLVRQLIHHTDETQAGRRAVVDWLRVEYDIEKPSQKLQDVAALAVDSLVEEVKKARGKKNPLSVAGLKALRQEHARSIVPLQDLAREIAGWERQVADLVNVAYGLTPEEVGLMWRTAPPRTPGMTMQ
jgi:hypothetical protein